jgi:hypothetical protein
MMITIKRAEQMGTNDLLDLLRETLEALTEFLEHPGADTSRSECWEIYQRLNEPVRILRDEVNKRIREGRI